MGERESKKERVDRELNELLQELRVALPGIQVLFAFLLILPFTQRFGVLTEVQRAVFYGSFLATAVSSFLLIAPTAYHRIRWRRYDKERMLFSANRMAITGLAFMALAMGGVVFLISDVMFGVAAAVLAAGVAAALVLSLWFGLPLSRTGESPDGTRPSA